MRRAVHLVPAMALLGGLASTQTVSAATRPAATVHVSPFAAGHAAHRAGPATVRSGTVAALTVTVTEWVSNTRALGGNTSCSDPGFSTIGAALLAAPSGATVQVCAGTYAEQLAITQPVKLRSLGATVQLPATPSSSLTPCDADGGAQPNQDVVDICGAGTVAMSGFIVQGAWPSDVCNDSLYGIAVLGGSTLNLSGTAVENIGGDPMSDGCQGGVGIEVGLATSGTTADTGVANLSNVQVSSYQKNGITVDGAGSSATMKNVTVTGAGPTPAIAQNGIQVSDGATASISGSHVSGDACDDTSGGCGPDPIANVQSAGILLFDAAKVSTTTTTVTGSDQGVYSIEDYAWAYYTPPVPFTATTESFTHMTLANRYENAVADAGRTSLGSSSLSGANIGLAVLQASWQSTNAIATATADSITGAAAYAVQVPSDQIAGDLAPRLSIGSSSLDTSNAGGIRNDAAGTVVMAKKNWWGDATGPSSWSFGSGSSVGSNVNFFPWATAVNLSTFETCTTALNATTVGNDVVLCARAGTAAATLVNGGSGNVLLLGNNGPDTLIGSNTGETWIIAGSGANTINGQNGSGYIQLRGNTTDTLNNTSGYTIAA